MLGCLVVSLFVLLVVTFPTRNTIFPKWPHTNLATAYSQLPTFSTWQAKYSNSSIVIKKMHRYISKRWAKSTKNTSKKILLFFCWHKSLYRYRLNLLYRTACSYLLFNSTQSILFVSERSITNLLKFNQSQCCLYSRTATCFGPNRPPTQHSKTILNSIHFDWTYSIAFSVWDHSSLQSLVIQQLAVTELFCRAQWDVYW